MAEIYDSTTWTNLEALSGPVLAYADGAVSEWPAEGIQALQARIAAFITVLANEAWPIFDSETGNAGTMSVATAVANRFQERKPSTCYTNADNLPGLSQSLRAKGMHWTDAQFWPEPGCYLWAAAPGTTPGVSPSWCPVSPVAVQDRWMGGYDISTTFHNWPFIVPAPPAPAPAPPPPPPAEVPITVQLLQVQDGNTGDSVKALQILLNGRGPYALQTDGIFGPKTQAAVRGYQTIEHLAVDGIAGVHTWGALLGVPQ